MMYYKSRGPGPPSGSFRVNFYLPVLQFTLIAFISIMMPIVIADRHKDFEMKKLCKELFMNGGGYEKIDGALITSKNERNLDCTVTFTTLSVLQRFMLRFSKLRIDCNDHLYIYDAANAVGDPRADLTCRNTSDTFGVMFIGSNYVTLRYVTDAWGTELNGFELLITAFKNQSVQSCFDFRCTQKNHCISKDLVCDELNHCLDGSDETICNNKNAFFLFDLNLPTIVVIAVSLGLIILVLCVTLIACLWRAGRNDSPRRIHSNIANSTLSFPLENTYNANGNTIGLSDRNEMSCNNIRHKMSGNWGHPASLKLGYSEVRVRLYCQAK